jgi:ubiquitin carboxyl-terminal hydrolase 4/11/15
MDRLTEQQVKTLRDIFNKIRSTSTGLDKKGMLLIFPALKTFPQAVITKCFQLFTRDSNQIEFRTFCIIISKLLLSTKEDQSEFVFELFDCDNDGQLKESELDIFLKTQELFLRKYSENSSENFKQHKQKFQSIPVLKKEFLDWSLRNIELSDLLKPFEIIPSALTEKQVISAKMLNSEKTAGEVVFLISQEWWVAWKMYVRFQQDIDEDYEISINNFASIEPKNRTKPFALGDRPIEIFNNNLLVDERLKKNLKENTDFIVIKKDVWEQLLAWYGGGPTIARKVIEEKGRLVIDYYPLIFTVIPVDKNGVTQFERKKNLMVNKNCLMRELLELCSKLFEKTKELSRILYQRNGAWDHLINPEGKVSPLLADGSELLLETAFIEKNVQIWPTEKKEKVKAGSETSANDTGPQVAPEPKKAEKTIPKLTNSVIPGISGLANLGNTCYLNSVLQSLLHTPMFEQFFIRESIFSYLNASFKGDTLAVDLNLLAREMFLSKNSKVIPKKFHKKFVKRFPMYEGTSQHDAHECLSLILNTLHEELSRQGEGKANETCTLENPEDKSIEILKADEQWKSLQGSIGSPISDVCGGQTRRTLTCENCGYKKVLFEVFYNLSVPVPASMEIVIMATVVFKKRKALQIGIFINKFLKITDLMQEIANLSGLSKEKLLLCFFYSGSPVIALRNNENDPIFRRIRENSNVFVFEVITTLEESESLGKKWAPYGNSLSSFKEGDHVDVHLNKEWKTGKIKVVQEKSFVVDLDYEDKVDIFTSVDLAHFRAHTVFENPKILHIHIYHQMSRNGKVECMGFPNIISIGNWYTYKDLTAHVKEIIEPFRLKKTEPCEYSLRLIENMTFKCAICKKCDGCLMPDDKNNLLTMEANSVAVLWDDGGFYQELSVHQSVANVEEKTKKQPIDISECFNSFTNVEKVDLECEKCKHKVHKTLVDIWRVPDILILCLVRFAYHNGSLDKIDQAVNFPFYALDISQWVKSVETSGGMTLSTTSLQNAYDLYSVIQHSGSIEAGHYTTLIKVANQEDSMWVSLDDGTATVIKEDPESASMMQNAYMLFYKRRKLSSSSVINLIGNCA